jgi:uncharacterized damage-inducible protein DinB
MLEAWLESRRVTLTARCEGLTDQQRKARPVTTSKLSLHGLIRHMAEVERYWFRAVLDGDLEVGRIWANPTVHDSEMFPLARAHWAEDLAAWEAECGASRLVAARHEIDDVGMRGKQPYSLRWIYVHMIQEYARHNGHADLIRELIDGAVGRPHSFLYQEDSGEFND